MSQEKENLLTVLKAEMEFVERGGYRTPPETTWRPQFIFQDSPICLNYKSIGERQPCGQCKLMDLVPKSYRAERYPCRYIPLDESGQTLDFLYRTGTEEETHEIVANWLRSTIARLESNCSEEARVERAAAARSDR